MTLPKGKLAAKFLQFHFIFDVSENPACVSTFDVSSRDASSPGQPIFDDAMRKNTTFVPKCQMLPPKEHIIHEIGLSNSNFDVAYVTSYPRHRLEARFVMK